jgi:calcineurin-like phosphoesterase family protein
MDWSDDLYILGDCFLNNNEEGIKLMKRLPGMKHVIWGNHDTDARKELIEDADIHILGFAHMQKFNNIRFYLSHYPTCTSNFDDDKPLKARTICLAGHTHSKEKWSEVGSYNVALDAHNCYPVLLDDIIKDVKEKFENASKNN